MGDRAPSAVGREDRISERRLMQPRLDLAKSIAALWSRWQGSLSRGPHERSESKLDP